jgi:RNA polymerase sigma factor (sigma-70 family)
VHVRVGESDVATSGVAAGPSRAADDAEVVRAAVRREPGSWHELVRRFSGLVWAIAKGMGLADADAQDVSQTVWLRLAGHLERIEDPEKVKSWIGSTTRNESLRVFRRAHRHVLVPADAPVMEARSSDQRGPDQALLMQERDSALWEAFEQLSGPCKLLLRVLIAEPRPTYDEVAEYLHIAKGSIGPQRSRCLGHLRETPGIAGPGGVGDEA